MTASPYTTLTVVLTWSDFYVAAMRFGSTGWIATFNGEFVGPSWRSFAFAQHAYHMIFNRNDRWVPPGARQ